MEMNLKDSSAQNYFGGFCRICMDDSSREPLISPCYCKGTMGVVHETCLLKWLHCQKQNQCEVCHFQFETVGRPSTLYLSKRWWGSANRIKALLKEGLRILIPYAKACAFINSSFLLAHFCGWLVNEPMPLCITAAQRLSRAALKVGGAAAVGAVVRREWAAWRVWSEAARATTLRLRDRRPAHPRPPPPPRPSRRRPRARRRRRCLCPHASRLAALSRAPPPPPDARATSTAVSVTSTPATVPSAGTATSAASGSAAVAEADPSVPPTSSPETQAAGPSSV